MLFQLTWQFIEATEDQERRHVALFAEWAPPADVDLQAFYNHADYSGGMAIVEVDDTTALARTMVPWLPWLRFTATPIVPVEQSIAMRGEAVAFRDSVS